MYEPVELASAAADSLEANNIHKYLFNNITFVLKKDNCGNFYRKF